MRRYDNPKMNNSLKMAGKRIAMILTMLWPLMAMAQGGYGTGGSFNPENPGVPGANSYFPDTHTLVIDAINGRLESLLYEMGYNISDTLGISYEEFTEGVEKVILCGELPNESDDVSILTAEYPNLEVLDMTRTYGKGTHTFMLWREHKLTTLMLPETVELVSFPASSTITEVYCYAEIPPVIDMSLWSGNYKISPFANPKAVVVHVPAASVSLYQTAEYWKDTNIVPLEDGISTIVVNMPEGVDTKEFTNMNLTLTDEMTGVKTRYIINGKGTYYYPGLRDADATTWAVTLTNRFGSTVASEQGIKVSETLKKVDLKNPVTLHTAHVSVAADGKDVTGDVQCTWYDAYGNRLTSGAVLAGMVEGDEAKVEMTLPTSLITQYAAPAMQTVKATASGASCEVTLQPTRQYTLNTTVRDAQTRHPIAGATVSAVQKFTDNYSYTSTAQTGTDGHGGMKVREGSVELVVTAPNYSSASISIDADAAARNGVIDIDDIMLTQSGWNTISMKLRLMDLNDGRVYPTQANDMTFKVYNNTKDEDVKDVRSDGSVLTLADNGIEDGDELTVTLISATGLFENIDVPVTIHGTTGAIDAVILPKGGFHAKFKTTKNPAVTAVLFDSEGKRVGTYKYPSSQIKVAGINSGNYTLVTMADDPALTGVGSLDVMMTLGLREGEDYVVNEIEIQNGQLTEVENDVIPTLDSEEFRMTLPATTLTLSETEVIQGSYVTLRSKVCLKQKYTQSYEYSNYKFVVDIPEGCEVVAGSVMLDKEQVEYDEEDGKVIVDISSAIIMSQYPFVSMCVVPKNSGKYNFPAYVGYEYMNDYGEMKLSPIGSVALQAESATFNISPFSFGSVQATGKCAEGSTINVYADGALVDKQVVTGTSWIVDVPLKDKSNLSVHPVSMECITPSGAKYTSFVENVLVNKDANRVNQVTMLYDNEFSHQEEVCIFDFLKASRQQQTYDFYPASNSFTFVIDFVRNDTAEVRNVELYVEQIGGALVPVKAIFDQNRNAWVAQYKTGLTGYEYEMPVNVAVCCDITSEGSTFDRQGTMEYIDEMTAFINQCSQQANGMNEWDADNVDQKVAEYENSVGYKLRMDSDEDISDWKQWFANLTAEEKAEELESMLVEVDDIIARTDSLCRNLQAAGGNINSSFTAEDGTRTIVSDCSKYNESEMESLGFTKVTSEDGTCVYVFNDETRTIYVDFVTNMSIEEIYAPTAAAPRRNSVFDDCAAGIQQLGNVLESVTGVFNELLGNLQKEVSDLLADNSKLVVEKMQLEFASTLDDITPAQRVAIKLKLAKVKMSIVNNDMALSVAEKMPGFLKKLLPIANYAMMIADFGSQFKNLYNLYLSIPVECKDDAAAAEALRNKCLVTTGLLAAYCTGKFAAQIAADVAAASSAVAAVPTGGASLVATVGIYIAKTAAVMAADWAFNKSQEASIAQIRQGLASLECEKDDDEPEPEVIEVGVISRPRPNYYYEPYNPKLKPVIDPSGFVCEAVESNRVEGATVTCYYKREVEDEYGEKSEKVVVWDAENYGQENPLLTDAQGMYSWMVPVGNWQVVYEKEGYETQRSAWLPVPPPQLDVNVNLIRYAQPTVADAQAYENGIDIAFDLYMKNSTVNDLTVTVEQGGKTVEGSLKATNEECSYDDEEVMLASRYRFVTDSPLAVGSEVKVKFSRLARSYADIPMGVDVERTLTVGREITFVGAEDSVSVVPYLGSHQIVISARSAEAAAYHKVTVRPLSDNIAAVDAQSVTLDAEGKAYITVDGLLPGVTYLQFSVDGTQVSGMSEIHVVNDNMQIPAAPRASLLSGMYVEKGTQVTLTADEGCTIYYTLDGSCPCDETKRVLYTGPITITKDMKLRTLAVSAAGVESESVTYTWFVDGGDGIEPVIRANTGDGVTVYDINGQAIRHTIDDLHRGIYIIRDASGTKKVLR